MKFTNGDEETILQENIEKQIPKISKVENPRGQLAKEIKDGNLKETTLKEFLNVYRVLHNATGTGSVNDTIKHCYVFSDLIYSLYDFRGLKVDGNIEFEEYLYKKLQFGPDKIIFNNLKSAGFSFDYLKKAYRSELGSADFRIKLDVYGTFEDNSTKKLFTLDFPLDLDAKQANGTKLSDNLSWEIRESSYVGHSATLKIKKPSDLTPFQLTDFAKENFDVRNLISKTMQNIDDAAVDALLICANNYKQLNAVITDSKSTTTPTTSDGMTKK